MITPDKRRPRRVILDAAIIPNTLSQAGCTRHVHGTAPAVNLRMPMDTD